MVDEEEYDNVPIRNEVHLRVLGPELVRYFIINRCVYLFF